MGEEKDKRIGELENKIYKQYERLDLLESKIGQIIELRELIDNCKSEIVNNVENINDLEKKIEKIAWSEYHSSIKQDIIELRKSDLEQEEHIQLLEKEIAELRDDINANTSEQKEECKHVWKNKENKRYGSYYRQCQLCDKIEGLDFEREHDEIGKHLDGLDKKIDEKLEQRDLREEIRDRDVNKKCKYCKFRDVKQVCNECNNYDSYIPAHKDAEWWMTQQDPDVKEFFKRYGKTFEELGEDDNV